ncbi:MAG: hypothetical protein WBC44_12590 [Planctomycetaceae bacterium]
MITLYRTNDVPESREVQSALEDSCLAHRIVDRGAAPAMLAAETADAILVDDGEVFRGAAEILPHVEQLVALRDLWHKYGSDACYCDEQGNIE